MNKDLKPAEWILSFLFIGSKPGNPVIKDSLELYKEFFVFVKETKPELDSYFEFISYDYGPYSFKLKTELSVLQLLKLIKISRINNRTSYYLTKKGIEKAQILLDKIDQKTIEKITKIRKGGVN